MVAIDNVSAVEFDRASLEQFAANTHVGKFVKALATRFFEVEARLLQATAVAARSAPGGGLSA